MFAQKRTLGRHN